MRSQQNKITQPSRRAFMSGKFSGETAHIASLLVQARPEKIPAITAHLESMDGIEVHGTGDGGRMVVTAEAGNDGELVDQMRNMETVDGVILVSLVYHQVEELDQ